MIPNAGKKKALAPNMEKLLRKQIHLTSNITRVIEYKNLSSEKGEEVPRAPLRNIWYMEGSLTFPRLKNKGGLPLSLGKGLEKSLKKIWKFSWSFNNKVLSA